MLARSDPACRLANLRRVTIAGRRRLLPARLCARQTDHCEQKRRGRLLVLPRGATTSVPGHQGQGQVSQALHLELIPLWHAAATTAATAAPTAMLLACDTGSVHCNERNLCLEQVERSVHPCATAAKNAHPACGLQHICYAGDVPSVTHGGLVAGPLRLGQRLVPRLAAVRPHEPTQTDGQARCHGPWARREHARPLEGPAGALRFGSY